jgi:programmed cell death 8 (apoptosis-inducing factor)
MKAIRMKDPSADILIISDEPHPPYMRPPLSKELWFSEDPNAVNTLDFKDWQGVGRNAYYESKAYYEEVDPENLKASNDVTKVKLLTGVAATNLDVDRKVLHLANGKRLAYGKILLATGGVPKELPLTKDLPEDIKSKITTFRRVSDYQQLDAINKTGKHIVVIGGGFLGSELAYAIAKSGKEKGTKITQVFPEQGNMAQVFPRYLTQWTSGKMTNEGVELEKLSKVTNFEAEGDQVKVILDTGKSLVADHVVVATGIEPNVSLAKKAGLEIDTERGGILVNAELESRGDVFVAGDVSSYHDIALGRRRVEHHDHAVLSGRHAGENMVGPKKPYKHQSMFWSDLGPSIGYEAVGVVDSSLKTVGVWAKAPTDKENPHKPVEEEFGRGVVFYFRENRLVGVLTWNLFNKVELARELIKLNQFGPDRANELAAQFNIHGAH